MRTKFPNKSTEASHYQKALENKIKASSSNLPVPVKPGRVQVLNTAISARSGMGGLQDRGNFQQAQRNSNHPLYRGSNYISSREWGRWYYTSWEAKKIINIPVHDMLREKWNYKGLDETQSRKFDKWNNQMGLFKKLEQSLRQERLLGGSVILLGVAGQDEDPSVPLDYSQIQKNDLKFINVLSRLFVHKIEYSVDVFDPDYGSIEYYWIRGVKTHRSRLMVFDGQPLSINERYDLGIPSLGQDGFGQSVLAPIWDDLCRATGSRQAALHLINMASVLILKVNNLTDLIGTNEGQTKLNKLDEIDEQMSMYKAAMIDGDDIDVDQWNANFGSVPELIMTYLQALSAASDIPATRFLGQAPGGLNATGTSDLENYYNMIDARRMDRLNPQLEKYMSVAIPSFFGDEVQYEDIELEYPPLWNLSESELADIRTKDTANITNLVSMNILTEQQGLEELKLRNALKIEIKEPLSSSRENEVELFQSRTDKPIKQLMEEMKNAGGIEQ